MLLIRASVLAACLAGARSAHPNEFIGLLEGEKRKNGLLLTRLVIPSGLSVDSFSSSFSDWQTPPTIDSVGVFHSHPSYSNRPSRADRMAASKEGGVQLIACRPFGISNLAAYDSRSQPLRFRVIP